MFNLEKEDDVTKYVIKKEVEVKGVKVVKSPKIQRLVTDRRLRRKKALNKIKKNQYDKVKTQRTAYEKVLSNYLKEQKAAKNVVAAVAK
jgi:small subunit ribosomal protein S6e